jgi:ABC-type nitrate/sulfonate/bicarbonate transport system ATPase subunit
MPQKDLLMPWKTIAENVAIGRIVRGESRRSARAEALAILERFGLEQFADDYPSQLSGGMRQRVALARTFLAGNDVLLLDEPFGALDSLTRLRMQSWLMHIWQESAASVLFITHDVDEAIRLSDRVHVLTERPASIAVTIEVDLSRPRPYGTVLTPAFAHLKETAIRHLHTEEDPDDPLVIT